MTVSLASEQEIQTAYGGEAVARCYVGRRFQSQLMDLLHERQVDAVNALLRLKRPGRTLEVAPGPGRVTRQIDELGEARVLGV